MVFSVNNGMFPKITDIVDNPAITTMPGTDGAVPLTREWTGIAALDRQFTVLLVFFWQLLDGRHPAGTLQAAHFFGQMGAYWTLMQLEAKREGNKRRIIATTLIGLLYQNISVAITIPLWCLAHLLTLPARPTSSTLTAALSIDPVEARILPWAMTLGYILPSVAMAVPPSQYAPNLPAQTQQYLATAWQVFPLWTALSSALILRPIFTSTTTSTTNPATTKTKPTTTTPPHLFALLLATIPHAATLALSLTAFLLPTLFHAPTSFHPLAVFLPRYSPPDAAPVSLAAGVHRFMQWDEAVSGAASVVWAATVYLRDARTKGGEGRWGVGGVAARAVGWSVVGGPAAAAVVLVWGRDEVVFASL
ncbi:hypothetical protein SLS58_004628 [Diplodia intermedia]|uniref:Uncharacterized protein n=1 Tax=Diplodia intermedia TaxID=856260 RepID=A0ABR3TTV5_9PEZI